MNCLDIKNLLIPYLESELPESERAIVEAHLHACADCQKEKVLLEKTWSMLDGFQAPEVGRHFTRDLMARIHQEEEEKPGLPFAFPEINIQFCFRVLAPAMAFACVFIVICLLFQNHPFQEQQIAKEILPEQKEDTPTAAIQVAKVEPEPAVVEFAPIQQAEDVKIAATELAKDEKAKTAVPDEEIIRDLDVYENVDLYQNYALVNDLDVVENLDEKVL